MFGQLLSVLNKGKSVIPLVFNSLKVLSSAPYKAKLFAKNFSKCSNLEDSSISLPAFTCRTKLNLQNISVAPKMFKKVIGLNCITAVVMKNCEPELSYVLTELFRLLKGFISGSCI